MCWAFLFLSIDEGVQIHEMFNSAMDSLMDTGEIFYYGLIFTAEEVLEMLGMATFCYSLLRFVEVKQLRFAFQSGDRPRPFPSRKPSREVPRSALVLFTKKAPETQF